MIPHSLKLESVVALWHANVQTGEEYFDGSGFLSTTSERKALLITCWHNFNRNFQIEDYFIYQGKKHLISRSSTAYFEGNPVGVETWYTQYGQVGIMDDYAFLILDGFDLKDPIELGTTEEVGEKENLTLVSHNRLTGEQETFSCTRESLSEKAAVRYDNVGGVDVLNMIGLKCIGPEKGHSGGAVLHNDSGKCIGILHGGGNGTLTIIKAQTFLPRLNELQNGDQGS